MRKRTRKALRKIIVAVDLSSPVRRVVDPAVDLARKTGAKLLFVSVVELLPVYVAGLETNSLINAPTERDLKSVERRLARSLKDVRVPYEVKIVVGSPPLEIRRLADRHHVDLILVSSHSKGPVNRYLLGSVSEAIARDAHPPVWIAKGRFQKIRRIFAPLDGSAGSLEGLVIAGQLAKSLKATLIPASIIEEGFVPPYARNFLDMLHMDDIRRQWIRQRVTEVRRWLKRVSGVRIATPFVSFGNAKDDLSVLAKKVKADLVVMSKHGKTALGFSVMGRVTSRMIHQSPCSIVVTRPKGWRYKHL